MPRTRFNTIGLFLWLEAATLTAAACFAGENWLLPAAALLFLTGGIALRLTAIGFAASLAVMARAVILLAGGSDFPTTVIVLHPVAALLLGIGCTFTGILAGLSSTPRAPVVARLGHLTVIIHFLAAGLLFADARLGIPAAGFVAWTAAILWALILLDTASKCVSRLYTPRRHWDALPAFGAFFFYRWLGGEWRKCLPADTTAHENDSLKLSEMWMWPTVRRSIPALAACSLLLLWLGTAVHEVGPSETGVRQRLGAWEPRNLAPGLHFSQPHPFGGVRKVETGRLHETVLGFRADPGSPILWERAHYDDEEISLVGGGDDYLSISIPVFHRCENPADALRATADPEGLLRSLASRILQRLAAGLPASEIMTTAREPLRAALREELQRELDARRAGIRVVDVFPRDIHPPVEVAPFFQEVVGAIEEKEAFIHLGEDYRNDNLQRYAGNAKAIVAQAESSAANRLLAATGEATRFRLRADARRENPALHDLREGFRMFDLTLGGAKKAIFDDRIRGQMPTHLDLRKVLNPDLVSVTPPAPQTLIFRPVRSREAFDLEIEGFLRADRGEIPAPDFNPADADNLLDTP